MQYRSTPTSVREREERDSEGNSEVREARTRAREITKML
jgi:hypothetical protein